MFRILLTNDDGIYAPGLAAMERMLRRLGDVTVVAPAREQSGVSHSITFLTPLTAKRVFVNNRPWGWMVDGSPADCVKLGVTQIMETPPDVIVSGMNGGLNAGINVFYSGTVGAAVEGAFYGIVSFAVSVEYDENEPFDRAAELATEVIGKILAQKKSNNAKLYNINVPQNALKQEHPKVICGAVDVRQYWDAFERRIDPMGRPYFWLTGRPDPRQPNQKQCSTEKTDLSALRAGHISVTPLDYDVTHRTQLAEMDTWDIQLDHLPIDSDSANVAAELEHTGPCIRVKMK
ncbi:MAG: 5'/3'-nucleotidase SurE [Thermoguttaceae bacterium]